jgi:hypothetical protein
MIWMLCGGFKADTCLAAVAGSLCLVYALDLSNRTGAIESLLTDLVCISLFFISVIFVVGVEAVTMKRFTQAFILICIGLASM